MGRRWTVATWTQAPGYSPKNRVYEDEGGIEYLAVEGEGPTIMTYRVIFDIEMRFYNSGCSSIAFRRKLRNYTAVQSFGAKVRIPSLQKWAKDVIDIVAPDIYKEARREAGNMPLCDDKYTISNIRTEFD